MFQWPTVEFACDLSLAPDSRQFSRSVGAEAFNGTAFAPYTSLPALQGNVHAVTFRNESVCVVGRRGGYGVVPPSLGESSKKSQFPEIGLSV